MAKYVRMNPGCLRDFRNLEILLERTRTLTGHKVLYWALRKVLEPIETGIRAQYPALLVLCFGEVLSFFSTGSLSKLCRACA